MSHKCHFYEGLCHVDDSEVEHSLLCYKEDFRKCPGYQEITKQLKELSDSGNLDDILFEESVLW